MRFGLIFSIVFHSAIILVAALTIVRIVPIPLPQDEIPIDVVTIDDMTNVKAQAPQDAKPEEQPAPTPAPPPEPQTAPQEPASNQAVLTPEEKTQPAKPEPPKPQAKPTPPAPDKPKDDKFNPDAIQVLIDKAKKQQEKQQKSTQAPAPSSSNDKPRDQVGAGADAKVDVATFIRNAIQRQMAVCWSFPAGAVQPESLIVQIHILLRPDGSLSEPPTIMDQSRMDDPYYRAAAEAAVRAINRCQPFQLPAEYYDTWKDLIYVFDPRAMVGQ
jgi:outer membrane biosynthesis protein TonB